MQRTKMEKIELFAGTSENIQLLAKVKMLNRGQSAGKTRKIYKLEKVKNFMGFVRIENYDREYGYLGDECLRAASLNGVPYLASYPDVSVAYRVVRDNKKESFAIATDVRNEEVLTGLKKVLQKDYSRK